MCNHDFVHLDYCRICQICGLEEHQLRLDTYNVNSAPLHQGYNRRARFRLKVDKLIGYHSGPNVRDPVWAHLQQCRGLKTSTCVRRALRSFKISQKHYDSVRLFTRVFTPFVIPRVNTLATKESLEKQFEHVLVLWNRSRLTRPFFSYDFLLRRFLECIRSPLIVFVKPYTCKKRRRKYENLLFEIGYTNLRWE